MADHAVRLGPAPARESYLSVPALLAAAKKTGATLVHPGYGFLAENAAFARACARRGPDVRRSDARGDRGHGLEDREPPAAWRRPGVPVVPGNARPARRATRSSRSSRGRPGIPILLKASAGGGGKGMRRVDAEAELPAAFARVSAEAQASFGDGAVYAEKLDRAAAAHRGPGRRRPARATSFAVGERECSIQRRHQKVVEECPSPVVDDGAAGATLRGGARGRARRRLHLLRHRRVPAVARRVLLLPRDEHAAAGRAPRDRGGLGRRPGGGDDPHRPRRSAAVRSRRASRPAGHAIECRVYAEDPRRGFAPSPGRIAALRLPQGPGVRNDVGVETGSVVPIDYDPMLGKLDRARAGPARPRSRGSRARSSDYEIAGVETTLPLFRALVARSRVRARGTSTCSGSTGGSPAGCFRRRRRRRTRSGSAAAGLGGAEADPGPRRRRSRLALARGGAARGAAGLTSRCATSRLILAGRPGPEELALELDGSRCAFSRGGPTERAEVTRLPDGRLSLLFDDGRQICGRVRPRGRRARSRSSDGGRAPAHRAGRAAAGPAGPRGASRRGRRGRRGDPRADAWPRRRGGGGRRRPRSPPERLLLVLEAMKMQNEIRSSRGGTVLRVDVEPGQHGGPGSPARRGAREWPGSGLIPGRQVLVPGFAAAVPD